MRGKVAKILRRAAKLGDNEPSYKELKQSWQQLSSKQRGEVRTWR